MLIITRWKGLLIRGEPGPETKGSKSESGPTKEHKVEADYQRLRFQAKVVRSVTTRPVRALRVGHRQIYKYRVCCFASGLLALVALNASCVEATSRGQRILDEFSYWRSFYVLRPARFSFDGWKQEGRSPESLKLDEKFLLYPFNGHWGASPILFLANTAAPPSGWGKPEFGDSAWTRMRNPLLMGAAAGCSVFAVGSSCHRTRFWVENPAEVRGLRLTVKYRGGVVVWLNGTELARGHVPPGKVDPDTGATPYTEAEYVLPPRDDIDTQLDPRGRFKGQRRAIMEISEDYEETLVRMRENYQFEAPITREGNADLMKRRNRVLGPIEIPSSILRRGVNVLAVQSLRSDIHPCVRGGSKRLGPAAHYGWTGMAGGLMWLHGGVLHLELTAEAGVQPEQRPSGLQIWTESVHHRVFSNEFGEPGNPDRLLRIVSGRNGTCSAQLVLGTDRPLTGLSASVSDLSAPERARIPSSFLRIRYAVPRPIRDLAALGVERNPQWGIRFPLTCNSVWSALIRHGPRDEEGRLLVKLPLSPPNAYRPAPLDPSVERALDEIKFFDELGPDAPPMVPANSCQPVWVTVHVPDGAQPGLYVGVMTLRTDQFGLQEVPVRLAVMDVHVPAPAKGEDFTTLVAMEQSPWGVARAYGCPVWTEEHFAHMEKSLRLMAELGNDYYILPVLINSEFGNGEDSFVIWLRRKDGTFACDFSRLDRYLDLIQQINPQPLAICYGVAHPSDNNVWVTPQVLLREEATGKIEPFTVPLGEANPFRGPANPEFSEKEIKRSREFWQPFVEGVMTRMRNRGWEQNTFWGYLWDYTHAMDRYRAIFDELAPEVKWARGSHGHGGSRGHQGLGKHFGLLGTIVCLPQPVERSGDTYMIRSHKGWKTTELHLALPRVQNAVLCVEGHSAPYYWRLFPELALCSGARGVCRIGADYWNGACQAGWRGGVQAGLGITCTFWPGRTQAHSSARFEMLREGLQEAEMRVIVEKAIEAASSAKPGWQEVLDNRIVATLHLMRSYYTVEPAEQDFGWQERSWDLYAVAAAATGGKVLTDAEKRQFFAKVD
ncbi:MAG: glycoside hydrolase domain-containing protein [Kiritimatiellia bacterium]